MSAELQLTPMMAQYRRIKSELPKDALLLFRLGDFYEMFFEDALAGAQLLNLALTSRNGTPMCGLPFHAANGYIARILKAGRKVAICDQTEEAKPGKLVNREVTQILSPGTHFDERMLVAERNNFLAAVYPSGKVYGLALVDLTTGDFMTTELESDAALLTELERLRPAEIIFPSEVTALKDLLCNSFKILSGYDGWVFAPETALYTVRDHFKVASLDGFGLKNRIAAIGAAGAALHYLTQNLRRDVKHLTRLSFYRRTDFLALDHATLRHLEILEPLHHDAPRNASLYGAMNKTVTPMGARLLRSWLSQPLAAVEPIIRRQDVVQTFLESGGNLDRFRSQLANVRDLERTLGRLSTGSGNARDLAMLRMALEQIPTLKQTLSSLVAADVRRLTLKEENQSLLTSAATEELIRHLRGPGQQYQFAPSWSGCELSSLQPLGLSLEDFHSVRSRGRIAGCAALWDQRAFKQTVIRGYAPWLAAVRPMLNLVARATGRPRLPAIGETLANAFVSHLAVAVEDSAALVELIAALRKTARRRGIELLTFGFDANDPRLATIRANFRAREYRSRLYIVRWPGVGGAASELDDRLLAPEAALL